MNNFKVEKNCLVIGSKKIDFEYPIEKALYYKGIYLVLLNPDSHKQRWGQFQNLLGVSPAADILWKAELPTTTTGDSYHDLEIVSDKINAYSWCSYECSIDFKTGRIIEKSFTK